MSRLLPPIALALLCLGCRFDTRGLPPDDLGLTDRARDLPTDALLEGGRADRPDAGAADRGAADRSGDLPPLPPLVPPPYLVSKDGWGIRLPLVESGENLSSLWLSPSGPAWAVSDDGRILHSPAFGRDWRRVASPTAPLQEPLRAVSASSPADVWIVGDAGTVIHYDGKTIAAVTVPTLEDLYGVHAFSPADVWIVGDANTVLHFDGTTWSQLSSPASATATLHGVWGASPAEVWVVGSGGQILRFAAGGVTKLPSGSGFTLNAIWGAAANDIWAVGNGGTLLHYDGAAWSAKPSSTTAGLAAIHGTSASEVRAVGISGTIIRLVGGAWKQEPIAETPSALTAIAASSAGNVLVAGVSSVLRRFDGAAWSKLALRSTPAFAAVWSGDGETWAVGKTGLVLRSGIGGWQVIDPPAGTADLNAIWSAPGSERWVAGAGGLIARWSSASKSWIKSASGTSSALNGLWGRSPSDLWAVGAVGTILRFDGTGWTTRPALHPATLFGVHGTSAQLFAAGALSRVIEFDGTWSITDLQMNTSFRAVWTAAPSSAWFVGDGGALAYYDGTKWLVKTGGTNLFGLFGLSATQLWTVGDGGTIFAIGSGLSTTPLETDSPVDLAAIHGSSASDLWAVGASGTILHHDDRLP